MALRTILDDLSAVDDAVKALYTEAEDGKFVLAVEGIDDHPDVARLKNAYDRVKSEREELRGKVESFQNQLKEMETGKPDQAEIIKIREALEAEKADAMRKVQELEGKLTGVTRDKAIADALQAVGVTKPTFLELVTKNLSDIVRMENGQAIVESDMGPIGVTEYVKKWAASPKGRDFVSEPVGGGAKGGSAGGTFIPKNPQEMSDVQRRELLASDPARFREVFGL